MTTPPAAVAFALCAVLVAGLYVAGIFRLSVPDKDPRGRFMRISVIVAALHEELAALGVDVRDTPQGQVTMVRR